jgi:hypothetical protein
MNLAEFLSQLRWRPQIGDPSIMGWLTVVAYGAAAALCFFAAFRHPISVDTAEARRGRRIWFSVALLMVFLCINKQLDLQSLITDVGRALANREGWYAQRRIVQRWFVLAVAIAGTVTLAVLAWRLRAFFRERILLLVGLTLLLTFIVIRAASFHHVDVLIMSRVFGLRINWILELGGIALIALGTARSILRSKSG